MAQFDSLESYLEDRRTLVEVNLQEFIRSRYTDQLTELATYAITGGKRLRGIMAVVVCEALGSTAERAMIAASAVELCHSASLVKDDVMDGDDQRRGSPAFWKVFGMKLALLVPDMLVPHATLFTQTYGPRALMAVVSAWSNITKGQLLDFPQVNRLLPLGTKDYERIIGLKTAPLFEVSAELGARASGKDWHINLAKQYGFNSGMSFQIYDDACDLWKGIGQEWQSIAKGDLPVSLQALKSKLEGGQLITQADVVDTLALGDYYHDQAIRAAEAFPPSEFKEYLIELPKYCCQALLKEAGVSIAKTT